MDEYNTILDEFDNSEPDRNDRPVPYINPTRTSLLEELKCLKAWGRDTGLYEHGKHEIKHDFHNLPSVTKSSITDSLAKMKATLRGMRGTVGLKGQHWMERPHELMPPDFDIRGVLLGQLGNLRCIIVNLELSIDQEDEPNAGRDDASPGIKMLFRRCATEYTTVFERIHESSSSLKDKLAFGHIEGPRNEFIRWGREAGILREGRKSLETKIVDSDKSESRGQIVNNLLTVESVLGGIMELLPKKRVLGEDLPLAASDRESETGISLSECAKELEEQIPVLRQCNESLTREINNLVRK